MALSMTMYLVIDVGGTYLKSAVLDKNGAVVDGSSFMAKSFSYRPPEIILQAFEKTISNGLEHINARGMKLGGIGIATPGPFNYAKGIPLMKHKFASIYGVNLRSELQKISNIPSHIPIQFMHDANAVLAGEMLMGNAQGFDNAAIVTLGTGLGFAFCQNKVIQCNELGGPKESIYNLPYQDGILEDYTAKRGFLKIYQEISGKKDVDNIKVSELGNWANEGDKSALLTFQQVGKILSESLRNILEERNIQCLLFGGQISRSFQYMQSSLKEGLKDVVCLKKISVVKSIDNAALYGAFNNINNLTKLNLS